MRSKGGNLKRARIVSVMAGAAIGFINGFFGGGGGMICVPLLGRALKKPTKTAHATAILIILPVSIAGAVIYFIGGKFNFSQGLPAGAGVLAGGVIGALLLAKLNNKAIRLVFAAVMIGAGAVMVAK